MTANRLSAASLANALRARVLRLRIRDYGIVAAFLALFIGLSLSSSVFATQTNLLNILDQNAPYGIIACLQTVVIIGGGFDLSVGAMFALGGVVAAQTEPHIGVPASLVVGS